MASEIMMQSKSQNAIKLTLNKEVTNVIWNWCLLVLIFAKETLIFRRKFCYQPTF